MRNFPAFSTLEVLLRLGSTEPKLVEWLQERLEQHKDDIVKQGNEVALRIAQGRAQELIEILGYIQRAQEHLECLRKTAS